MAYYSLMHVLSVLLAVLAFMISWRLWYAPTLSGKHVNLDGVYDYIIVGAGSAGSVLANRLSENASSQVLVLEAGKEELRHWLADIPLFTSLLFGTLMDWRYKTVPQDKASLGLREKESLWPRGKALGGSSAINFMIYIRGSRHDYDQWAVNGCEGWSYRDVLPYFIKMEENHNQHYLEEGYHGNNGPLTVTDAFQTEVGDAFLQAGQELGYSVTDVNGADQIGVSRGQANIKNGVRWGTDKAYLLPARDRTNLHVLTGSQVVKVLFDGKRAIGVMIIKDGVEHVIKASNEIILSAGTIGSPQILILSGIGPRQHLESLNIPVLCDLPVGENLQDHLMTPLVAYTTKPLSLSPGRLLFAVPEYFIYGTGPLSSSGGVESVGFFHTSASVSTTSPPDLQIHLMNTLLDYSRSMLSTISLKAGLGIADETGDALFNAPDREGFTILNILLHPYSRGTLRLRSTDPLDQPLLDPHYLEHPKDVQQIVSGIRLSQKLFNTKALKRLGTEQANTVLPQCKSHGYETDAYWECYVRHIALSIHHQTSTCKMGSKDDQSAVVDPQLRVKGVENLRVVDASVIPSAVSGNTNVPVMMIAEKAADIIKRVNSVKNIKLPQHELR